MSAYAPTQADRAEARELVSDLATALIHARRWQQHFAERGDAKSAAEWNDRAQFHVDAAQSWLRWAA